MARRKQAPLMENREGLRPGDPCEHCGTPKVSLGVAKAIGVRFHIAGCPNCKGGKPPSDCLPSPSQEGEG